MKQVFFLSIMMFALCLTPVFAQPYNVVGYGDYFINGVDIGFTDTNPDIRGLSLNPATGNILISERYGQIAVVNRSNGSTIKFINNAGTGDQTIPLFRVKTSSDGQIYTVGYEGSVKRVGTESVTDAAASPIVIGPESYSSTGFCRGLYVTGSYAAGTVRIISCRGTLVHIWQQSGAASDTFTIAQTINTSAAGLDAESHSYWARDDFSEVLVYRQQAGVGLRKFTGSIASGYTWDSSYAGNIYLQWLYSIAVDPVRDILVSCNGANVTEPGQMTRVAVVRYSNQESVGEGNVGNTSFGLFPGNYVWGSAGVSNTAGDAEIDSVNHKIYAVSRAGLMVLNLEFDSGIDSWMEY